MLEKPQLVVANKIDARGRPDAGRPRCRSAPKKLKLTFFKISAVTGEGLPALLEALWVPVAEAR